MTYVSWAALHEGSTDALYFEVLLPRLMEAIVMSDGVGHSDIPLTPAIMLGKKGRAIDLVAAEICEAQDAFQLVFIHADTGGRALQQGLDGRSVAYCQAAFEKCKWPISRCVTVTPRHETEAWILADPDAVTTALGYNGDPGSIGLPATAKAAEGLVDPKATLQAAMRQVSGQRRRVGSVQQIMPAIAQRQSLDRLREAESFAEFEGRLRACLVELGCLPRA